MSGIYPKNPAKKPTFETISCYYSVHNPEKQLCMKQILLSLLLVFVVQTAFAQANVRNVRVFPNPATEFFKVDHHEAIAKIKVLNIAGRMVRNFVYESNQKYAIGDLPQGIYLIQLLDYNNKAVLTRRVSKR
jgi:hypothetical protein